MDAGMVYYGLGVLLVAALVVWLGRDRKPANTVGAAVAQMAQAAARAQDLVAAAEQLWATGRLAKDDRFLWVAAELRRLFPGLDEAQVTATIEAAVYFMKLQLRD